MKLMERLFFWWAGKIGYKYFPQELKVINSNLKYHKLAGTIQIARDANILEFKIREAIIQDMKYDLASCLTIKKIECDNPHYLKYYATLFIGLEGK